MPDAMLPYEAGLKPQLSLRITCQAANALVGRGTPAIKCGDTTKQVLSKQGFSCAISRGLYPFGHSRELLARKKNLGLEFELIFGGKTAFPIDAM